MTRSRPRVRSRVRYGARRRWTVVAAVTAVLAALPLLLGLRPAADEDVSAGRLLELVRASGNVPWSGYAEATGRLALPDVRELGDVAALLGGTTRLRVWWRAPADWRVDALDVADEQDTYAQPGGGTLTWSSGERRAVLLPTDPPVRLPRGLDLVPAALARRLLDDLDPADLVVRTGARRVAGVDALGLAVLPQGRATTVGRVEVWVQPVTGLPLRTEITARGAPAPALTSSVSELTAGAPSPDLTSFDPGPDSQVETVTVPDVAAAVDRFAPYVLPEQLAGLARHTRSAGIGGAGGVGTYGRGLTLLAVVPLPDDQARSLLRRLDAPVAREVDVGAGSGALVQTALASVLVARSGADDGRAYLLAGTVTPELLQRAAGELFAHPPRVQSRGG